MVKSKKINLYNETERQLAGYNTESVNDSDPIFSHAYHNFIVNLLRTRDSAVKDEMREELSEVLKPMFYQLEQIANGQTKLISDMSDVKIDVAHMKCDITGIRQQVKLQADKNEEVHQELKKQIEGVKEMMDKISPKNTLTAIMIRGIIIALLGALIALTVMYFAFGWFHAQHLLSDLISYLSL